MKLSSVAWAVAASLLMTCSSAEASPFTMSPVSARPSKTEAKTKANAAKTDNTLLIKFAAGVDLSSAKKLLQAQGFKVKKVFQNLSAAKGHTYLSVTSAKKDAVLSSAEIQALSNTAGIDKVSRNYEIRAVTNASNAAATSGVSPSFVPDDSLYSQLWGMQNMDMAAAWNMETGNSNTVVFVIDTGIDTDHPELVNNLWTNTGEIPGNGYDDDGNGYVDDIHGIDVINYDSDPEDDHGHGTHVSGTIGAQGNNAEGVTGINWNVKIGACKFLDAWGSGWTEGAVQCFDYVLGLKNAGVNVVATNNSWGGGGSAGDTLNESIAANIAAGVLPVMAAGNSASDNDSYPMYPCAYTFSGAGVQGDSICVAAIDSSNNLAWFSSYGLTSVDVAAPGVDVLSTVPPDVVDPSGYASWSGTSMATPHVTGLAALLAAHNPSSSLTDIRQAILYGSVPTESLADKVATGGRVNGYISLTGHFPPVVSITSPAARSIVNGNVSIEAEASSDSGIAQVEFFVNDASVGIDSTAPYAVTWDSSGVTPDMYTVKAVATDGEGVTGSKQVNVYAVNSSSRALVLDLASDNRSGEAIGAALARNNVGPEFGSSITAIDPAVYPRTFVCLGYYSGQHVLTDTESADLSAYLNNSGTLYMEGGDTWAWDPDMPIHSYFGINGVADGTADLATVSGSGGSIVDGISFASVGVNTWVDHLEPENGGIAIWQNNSPVYTNGISNQTEIYRTIGCSFEFGNIPEAATQTQVMARYLSFLSVTDAKFEADVTSGTAPLAVQFTDLSTGNDIASWHWDFGDGTSSSDKNPTHRYLLSGCYTVSLTITTSNGNADTETKECFVNVTADLISTNTIGQITATANNDSAEFKITGMSGLADAATAPFSLRFKFGTVGSEPAYQLIADSDAFQIDSNRLTYRDAKAEVICQLNRGGNCTVNISDTFNEALLSNYMTVSLEIGGKNYANTGIWTEKKERFGSTVYSKKK